AEQRRRGAGAFRKWSQRAGNALGEYHAETGEVNGDWQNERQSRGQPEATAATIPRPPAAQAPPPIPSTPSSPSLTTTRAATAEPAMWPTEPSAKATPKSNGLSPYKSCRTKATPEIQTNKPA